MLQQFTKSRATEPKRKCCKPHYYAERGRLRIIAWIAKTPRDELSLYKRLCKAVWGNTVINLIFTREHLRSSPIIGEDFCYSSFKEIKTATTPFPGVVCHAKRKNMTSEIQKPPVICFAGGLKSWYKERIPKERVIVLANYVLLCSFVHTSQIGGALPYFGFCRCLIWACQSVALRFQKAFSWFQYILLSVRSQVLLCNIMLEFFKLLLGV